MAVSLDPVHAPRMLLFAWNVFFGARRPTTTTDHAIAPPPSSLTDLHSEFDMETLVMVYFDKVDPCYGFVDRQDVHRRVKERWRSPHLGTDTRHDAVLGGIAALGCLFSRCQSIEVEYSLAEGVRLELELTLSDVPDWDTTTAWVLHVAYLRMTSTPHPAWMASCMMMHVIEAAGLQCEPGLTNSSTVPLPSSTTAAAVATATNNDELRRRMFGVAHHLNMWMSFDTGRSRVVLRSATTILPLERPDDYTVELLCLLPYTEMLDTGRSTDTTLLASALDQVLLGTLKRIKIDRHESDHRETTQQSWWCHDDRQDLGQWLWCSHGTQKTPLKFTKESMAYTLGRGKKRAWMNEFQKTYPGVVLVHFADDYKHPDFEMTLYCHSPSFFHLRDGELEITRIEQLMKQVYDGLSTNGWFLSEEMPLSWWSSNSGVVEKWKAEFLVAANSLGIPCCSPEDVKSAVKSAGFTKIRESRSILRTTINSCVGIGNHLRLLDYVVWNVKASRDTLIQANPTNTDTVHRLLEEVEAALQQESCSVTLHMVTLWAQKK